MGKLLGITIAILHIFIISGCQKQTTVSNNKNTFLPFSTTANSKAKIAVFYQKNDDNRNILDKTYQYIIQQHNNSNILINKVLFEEGNLATKVKKLVEEDKYDVIIGINHSEDLVKLKNYINHSPVVVISPASTAESLALKDNILRMSPNDTTQAEIIASHVDMYNKNCLMAFYRNDVWGIELKNEIVKNVQRDGIDVIGNRNYYDADNLNNRSADSWIDSLIQMNKTINNCPLLMLGFSEVNDIAQAAAKWQKAYQNNHNKAPKITTTPWVGSEGWCLEKIPAKYQSSWKQLLSNKNFSYTCMMTQTTVNKDKFCKIKTAILDNSQMDYTDFILSENDSIKIIDAVNLAVATIEATKNSAPISARNFATKLIQLSHNPKNTISTVKLNDSGDNSEATYVDYNLKLINGNLSWRNADKNQEIQCR